MALPIRVQASLERIIETDALFGTQFRLSCERWLMPEPSRSMLAGVPIQSAITVCRERAVIRTGVDDAAVPNESIRIRIWDGPGLIPCDGGFNVYPLRFRLGLFEYSTQKFQTPINGLPMS